MLVLIVVLITIVNELLIPTAICNIKSVSYSACHFVHKVTARRLATVQLTSALVIRAEWVLLVEYQPNIIVEHPAVDVWHFMRFNVRCRFYLATYQGAAADISSYNSITNCDSLNDKRK